MVISQGDVCWASLEDPVGSGPGFRRPVVVVCKATRPTPAGSQRPVVVPLSSKLRLAAAPGNVGLPANVAGLPKDSVATVSQIVAIDREQLTERVGRVTKSHLDRIMSGIDLVLGREYLIDPSDLNADPVELATMSPVGEPTRTRQAGSASLPRPAPS